MSSLAIRDNAMTAQRYDPTQKLARAIIPPKGIIVPKAAPLYKLNIPPARGSAEGFSSHTLAITDSDTSGTREDYTAASSTVTVEDLGMETESCLSSVAFAGSREDDDASTFSFHAAATTLQSHSNTLMESCQTLPIAADIPAIHKVSVALEDDVGTRGSIFKHKEWKKADGTSVQYEVYRAPTLASKLACCLPRSPPPSPTGGAFSLESALDSMVGFDEPRGRSKARAKSPTRGKSPSPVSRAAAPLRRFRSFGVFSELENSEQFFDEFVDQTLAMVDNALPVLHVHVHVIQGSDVQVARGSHNDMVPYRGSPGILHDAPILLENAIRTAKRSSVISVGAALEQLTA